MKYIIANWKMNLPEGDYRSFCDEVSALNLREARIIIAAPSCLLSELARDYEGLEFALQNITERSENSGAFTGEISPFLLKKIGVNYSIIGHSERRKYFAETNIAVKNKANKAIEQGITPIICVGEGLLERQNNSWKDALTRQILDSIPQTNEPMIIAYEPVWAIGTGLSANTEEITEAANWVNDILTKLAKRTILVYGGSVNRENTAHILKIQAIEGVLVGNASLKLEEFKKIIIESR